MNGIKQTWLSPEIVHINGSKEIETGTPSQVSAESTTFVLGAVPPSGADISAACAAADPATTVMLSSICTTISTTTESNTSWGPPDGNFTTNDGTCTSPGAAVPGTAASFACS